MEIKLEKILTISASEYCSMVGTNLEDYTPIGIEGSPQELEVPDKTEVVVGYKLASIADKIHPYGIGTALIAKK